MKLGSCSSSTSTSRTGNTIGLVSLKGPPAWYGMPQKRSNDRAMLAETSVLKRPVNKHILSTRQACRGTLVVVFLNTPQNSISPLSLIPRPSPKHLAPDLKSLTPSLTVELPQIGSGRPLHMKSDLAAPRRTTLSQKSTQNVCEAERFSGLPKSTEHLQSRSLVA